MIVKTRQAALVLDDQLRLERGLSSARNVQFELAARCQDVFGTAALTVIAGLALLVFRIEMMHQLGI